jgi:NADH-quinone oxidoreductase subunit J
MMTTGQLIFIVVSAATLGAALITVINRNLFHSALWLIATLFGVAALFVLLEAGFLAAVQVLLYIGAIATLIIFAVMLTRRLMAEGREAVNSEWWLSAALAGVLIILLLAIIGRVPSWYGAAPQVDVSGSIAELGQSLVNPDLYVLPFEVASVMLLVALIGAIIIAREGRR